jgi:hypothetical protein
VAESVQLSVTGFEAFPIPSPPACPYITAMARSGMNLKTIQKLARRSTITLTPDRYATLDGEDIRRALDPPRTTNEQTRLPANAQG